MKIIVESSTSRIYKHLTDEYSCAIISAFRGENPLKVNLDRHLELKKDVRALGLGFIEFTSRWVEDGESFDEMSLLIPRIPFEDAFELGIKYDQASIIYKDDKACAEYCTNAFEDYSRGDLVREFNNVGPNMLNLRDAEDIFMKRKGGPVSKPKNDRPFTLSVIEKIEPKPSMFREGAEVCVLELEGENNGIR